MYLHFLFLHGVFYNSVTIILFTFFSGWLCEGRQIERGRARRIQRSRSRLPSAKNNPNIMTEISVLDDTAVPSSYTSLAGELYTSETAFHSNEKSIYEAYLQGMQLPQFIFHAAGHCGKLESLKGVLQRKNIEIPEEFKLLIDFKIPKINRTGQEVVEGDGDA